MTTDAYPLTPRQLEVLRLIAEGLTREEISERLVITMSTMGNHRWQAIRKLGARTGEHAIAVAIRRGLL